MKKAGLFLMALLLLLLAVPALAEEAGEDMAEWTVMFYFCGSDLESKYGYASSNLNEIRDVNYPDSLLQIEYPDLDSEQALEAQMEPGKVNVLIETGGSREWHTPKGIMDIDASALQRWSCHYYPMRDIGEEGVHNGFELMETLPLESMADPDTLADFIRWGVETCPAKKYALVLWDHGDGARSGMFIDELFDNDVLYLFEMKQALQEADAHFDCVIIDACLMANIETAWSIKDNASWMVASEEVVPGLGTAVGDWLQELLINPWGDGEWLGRCVCDTTSLKYANSANERDRTVLTWSVIDLSKIDALLDSFSRFVEMLGSALKTYPEVANIYMRALYSAVEYGDNDQNMRDLGSLFYMRDLAHFLDLSMRSRMLNALSDAVTYCVHGSDRSEARGLTFCYPMDFSNEQLDIYARNFPMPTFLSVIDAVSPWTAPDWVYENVERLPTIDEIEELQAYVQKGIANNGIPGIIIRLPEPNVDNVFYNLYRLNEDSGKVVRLGRTSCTYEVSEDFETVIWYGHDPLHWPAIDGQLICMDFIREEDMTKLYNVPVMLNGNISVLRCGRELIYDAELDDDISEYEIYGVWEGYDVYSRLLNRSVEPLAMLAGQEYRLTYPVDGTEESGRILYEIGEPLTLVRSPDVEEIPLPPGTYYLEYEIEDVFMRDVLLDRIEFHWDGTTITFPESFQWEDGAWMKLSELNKQ